MNENEQIRDVIDADPSRLDHLVITLSEDSVAHQYARVRLLYMRHRWDELLQLVDSLQRSSLVYHLGRLRLAIRVMEVSLGEMNSVAAQLQNTEGVWLVEIHNVLAMAWELRGEHQKARLHYLAAYRLASEHRCPKRATTTYHNAIAALSKLEPEKRLIYEYHQSYQLAKSAQDFGTCGSALSNLAREYQLMKAPELGLEYCNRAIEYIEKSHFGSYQHVNVLANRCQILIELGRKKAAQLDFETLRCFDVRESRQALKTLGKLLEVSSPIEGTSPLPGTQSWKERAQFLDRELHRLTETPLSELEQELLLSLSKAPQEKYDLVFRLYGSEGNLEDKENRFKQLLHRLRKKCPELVRFEKGKYRISEPSVCSKQA